MTPEYFTFPRRTHAIQRHVCAARDQYVPLGSRQIAKYYGCCDTMFVHPNHLGSTTMITNAAGTVMRDLVFYPYGQTWRNIGNNWDLHFASLWQREFASGLDPTPNRLYHSRLFRWMTPDEFTGGPTDAVNASVGGPDPTPPGPLPYADILNPQSLNKYAYVYNNPLRYTDPTGQFCLSALFGHGCNDDPQPLPSGDSAQAAQEQQAQNQQEETVTQAGAGALALSSAAEGAETGSLLATLPLAASGAAVVGSAYLLITNVTDTLVENYKGSERLSATESVAAVENNQAVSFAKGQGGQRKGERGQTAKPDEPGKHAKRLPDGRWQVKDPHTGKKVINPPSWSPDTAQ